MRIMILRAQTVATLSTIVVFLLYLDPRSALSVPASPQVQDKDYWYEEARMALNLRLNERRDLGQEKAKNVVLVVGDGVGLPTLTAARIFKGQREGQPGESTELVWDKFPALALVKTYNLNAQVGESSACATALLCGVKANYETVGLDARGRFDDCFSTVNSRVDSLIDWAQQEGKATGVVTNTRVTHATPAPLYAHSASRYWEDDSKVPPASRKTCKDIARQLVEDEPGRNINVILGGGRRHWLPTVETDSESAKNLGRRLDGRNLIQDWLRDRKKRGISAEYVWNKTQLNSINSLKTDHLLGLFAYSHLDFEADRDPGPKGDPSLEEMTLKSISILSKSPKGFFLLIEGGRIDHAHHFNNAYRALDETLQLEKALLAAMSSVNQSETLFILTSDHAHVMSFGGFATPRGNPILGVDSKPSDVDNLPYSTIMYGNGPGYHNPRLVPSNITANDPNIVQSSAVPRHWATHGGEDVPVFAKGPLASALFTGIVDQSYIPHAIAFIACLGHHKKRCQNFSNSSSTTWSQPVKTCGSPEVSSVSESGSSRAGAAVVLASSELSENEASAHRALLKYIISCYVLLRFINGAIT